MLWLAPSDYTATSPSSESAEAKAGEVTITAASLDFGNQPQRNFVQ